MREPTLEELEQELARRDLLQFIHSTMKGYESNWFHREVCSALEWFHAEVIAKRSPRLMLFAPPRHGKSEIVSRRFPAWALGKSPWLQFIGASYGDDLASRMNRDVQNVIDSPEYKPIFPNTCLNGSNVRTVAYGQALRNSDIFETVGEDGRRAGGVYRSAGVGGGITGMGAHVLIIDDPVKDSEQANSEVYQEKVWDWFSSTAYTRLMPGGGVLIILTRWHENDLAGKILARMKTGEGENYRVLSFPAVAEKDEISDVDARVLRRKGEALHPERYDLEALARIRKSTLERVWISLYQQRPSAAEGNRFKREWWRFWRPDGCVGFARPEGCCTKETSPSAVLPLERFKFDEVVMSVDSNFKDRKDADPAVVWVIGRKGMDRYLLDRFSGPVGFGKTMAAVTAMRARWPKARKVYIEAKANGDAIIETMGASMHGVIPVPKEVSNSGKEARAEVMEPVVQSGHWFLPEHEAWTSEVIDQFAQFPNATHDDDVDAGAQMECIWTTDSDLEFARKMGTLRVPGR